MALNEDQQTEAVFKSSRTEIDPVSGNEVPPGSLPEEVRDDIPAMLSEGEYVVPADVLRFYGVKFFEDLRAEAKMGLAEMEANGRIGGEPIETEDDELPFTDEELMVEEDTEQEVDSQMMAAMGGVVGYQQGGFQPSIPAWMSNLQNVGPGIGGGTQFKTFINDRGQELSVLVGADNQPIFAIPAGYKLKTERAPTETTPVEEAVTTKRKDDDDFIPASAQRARDRIAEQRADKEIDFTDPQSVEGAVNTYYSSQPLLQSGASAVLGLPGLAASYGIKKYEKNKLLTGINAAIEGTDDTDLIEKLKAQKELLEDKNKWKTSYEEKTEKLGLVDSIKNFFSSFSSEEIDKKYTKPEGLSNDEWKSSSLNKWVDATNLVNSLGSDADPREWHEAMQAQAEASREASAAARAASGWSGGFFGSASNDNEDEKNNNSMGWTDDEGLGVG